MRDGIDFDLTIDHHHTHLTGWRAALAWLGCFALAWGVAALSAVAIVFVVIQLVR